MHYTGTALAADTGKAVPAVIHKGIDQSAVSVAGRGVDDHAAGLVDDYDIGVLVDNIERYILRFERYILRRRQDDLNLVSGVGAIVLFKRLSAEGNGSGIETLLYLAA